GRDARGFFGLRVPISSSVAPIAFIPPSPLSTEVARGLLPDVVSHADAAANAGRTALLVAALAGQPELLLTGTEDFLHQAYRRPAMPESLDLLARLRADDHAAVISGAGPTVLVLTTQHADLAGYTPDGWQLRRFGVAGEGVHRV